MPEELLKVDEVAEALKISTKSVYKMAKDGKLGGFRLGNRWRFPLQAIEELTHGAVKAKRPVKSADLKAPSKPKPQRRAVKKNPDAYNMGFTSMALALPESITIAETYLELQDWKLTRAKVLEENLLQKNAQSTSISFFKVIRQRLQKMDDAQLQTLVAVDFQQQAMLLYANICKIHRFIFDFAVEVLRNKILNLDYQIQEAEYRSFIDQKALEHPEIEDLSKRSSAKVKQVMFRVLAEAGIIKSTSDWTLTPFIVPPKISQLVGQDAPALLKAFLMSDNDIRRASET